MSSSLSLWAILVPQSMAYAQLAGVPAVYGLYTAFAAMIPGLVIYRFDAPLFFANATVMSNEIAEMVASQDTPVETVLFDAESVYDVDTTAVQVLEDLAGEGVTFAVARLRTAVRETLEVAGVIDRIGDANIYLEVDDGVAAFIE